MKTMKIAAVFGVSMLATSMASAAGLTYAEEEAIVSTAYVMEISKGEPMEVSLRSTSEATVKSAFAMTPTYGTPYSPEIYALDEAVVDSAFDWSKSGFTETPYGNTATE